MDTVAGRGRLIGRLVLPVGVAAVLLSLAAANVAVRATWRELDDGVLWGAEADAVVAREVAPRSAAARAGLRPGDVLVAIDGRPVTAVSDVLARLHRRDAPRQVRYTILRDGGGRVVQLTLERLPREHPFLYYLLAGIAVFTLVVGTSVRLRRPSDQATLHFFWLTVAFFGLLAFSFSGRLDTLDWVFYWIDAVAMVLLPPLFLHFALVFPDRPGAWVRTSAGRRLLPLVYAPAVVFCLLRVAAVRRLPEGGAALIERIDRLEHAYLALSLVGGFAVLVRALARVRSVTARRQLRWIVWGTALGAMPFVGGYLLPYLAGYDPPAALELTALPLALVPLAFASSIVRYRLMDVEVILKRGLVYAAAIAAIAAIYGVLLEFAGAVFLDRGAEHNTAVALLATLVVVLLAGPVKNAIQTALDRAYYRDRYDYRRALVTFARELNSELDLQRLGERLVHRVVETLVLDRMVLLAPPAEADVGTSSRPGSPEAGEFRPIAASGADGAAVPRLARDSEAARRLAQGQTLVLDEAHGLRRLPVEEAAVWRQAGFHYLLPCVSKEGLVAVMALGRRTSGEPLSSEDMALLAAVAGQAATAVENARLYRQLRIKADELARMREFSESVIESLTDGLAVLDLEDRIVRWNRPMEAIYGLSGEAVLGRPLDAVFEPAFVESLRAARRDAPGGTVLYRLPLLTAHPEGGRRLLVNVATAPLRTPAGGLAGTIVIVEDVTARVQLEEQLQIAEKMASIGLLAAGVAHEVNTPLTGISSYTQLLLEQADPDDPRTKLLEKIERQTFRAAKIVNGLLNLARPAHAEKGPVDLNAVVNDVLGLLEHQFAASRIQVRRELCAPAPVVRGVEYKLQQVFLNLFLNARDAMPRGGWLSVATRVDGDRAVVEVADTGAGIPPEHLSRIYDPFFTTKPLGRGTGLGLSITYGIVQEHGGTIACESAVGQGTRFSVTLPLAAARSEQVGT